MANKNISVGRIIFVKRTIQVIFFLSKKLFLRWNKIFLYHKIIYASKSFAIKKIKIKNKKVYQKEILGGKIIFYIKIIFGDINNSLPQNIFCFKKKSADKKNQNFFAIKLVFWDKNIFLHQQLFWVKIFLGIKKVLLQKIRI